VTEQLSLLWQSCFCMLLSLPYSWYSVSVQQKQYDVGTLISNVLCDVRIRNVCLMCRRCMFPFVGFIWNLLCTNSSTCTTDDNSRCSLVVFPHEAVTDLHADTRH